MTPPVIDPLLASGLKKLYAAGIKPAGVDFATMSGAARWQREHKIRIYYPETGPVRRELYVKHMAFFEAGAKHSERAFIAGNRVGKTEGVSAYELTLHLTGDYPDWWRGRRFTRPIDAWAAGDTNQTTRDILQAKLCGKIARGKDDSPGEVIGLGTGLIPAEVIVKTTPKAGIPDALETVYVRHKSGGRSILTFKSYEQGRASFQGTEKDVICLDEEPPEDVFEECGMRIMATGAFEGGIIILTYTPLSGWTKVVELFLDEKKCREAGRFCIQAGWDDAPHLSEAEKKDRLSKLQPHQRDARSKGIPQLGAGAIYPVPESDFVIDPFDPPASWPRSFGLDVGWNWTAAVWSAHDRENDVVYVYSDYMRSEQSADVHAVAIRAKGEWIPGTIDPAANGRNQVTGESLVNVYRKLGLVLTNAKNDVAAGIEEIWVRLVSGRLKIMRNCQQTLGEMRLYRRDEKGKVVKDKDHLCDAMRYDVMTGLGIAKTKSQAMPPKVVAPPRPAMSGHDWMA